MIRRAQERRGPDPPARSARMYAPKVARPSTKTATRSPVTALAAPTSSESAVRPAGGQGWDFSKLPRFSPERPARIQAKLVVGDVADPREREADRAASQAMGSPAAAVSPLSRMAPTPGPPAATTLPLQRQWADAPVGPIGGATSTQVQAPSFGWNRGETSVGGIRRIPIETLRTGNQDQDAHPAAEEAADARAIVLIPAAIDLTQPVEVLLHLHGHNVGYRQRRTQGKHASLRPGSVRDIDTDRIEQQLEASHRPMIGVLPQGTTGSGFGAFNSDAYIADVL